MKITNDFHGTQTTIRATPGRPLTAGQVIRARRALRPVSGCSCGGNLGERGPQSVRIEIIGALACGAPEIVITPHE